MTSESIHTTGFQSKATKDLALFRKICDELKGLIDKELTACENDAVELCKSRSGDQESLFKTTEKVTKNMSEAIASLTFVKCFLQNRRSKKGDTTNKQLDMCLEMNGSSNSVTNGHGINQQEALTNITNRSSAAPRSRLSPTHRVRRQSPEQLKLKWNLKSSIPPHPKLQLNLRKKVEICHCIDMQNFWILPRPSEAAEFISDVRNAQKELIAQGETQIGDLCVGMVCAARYSKDDLWYRARIVDYLSVEEVKVYYLDYGNDARVPIEWIMPLAHKLSNIPVNSVRGTLMGFHPTLLKRLEEGTQHFRKLVADYDMTATFRDNFEKPDILDEMVTVYEVDLHFTRSGQEVSVLNELLGLFFN